MDITLLCVKRQAEQPVVQRRFIGVETRNQILLFHGRKLRIVD